jgi:hypothetical protein
MVEISCKFRYNPVGVSEMKTKIAIATFACIGLATASLARSPANSPSPFLGTWSLDVAHMPVTYGTPPKSVIYEFVDIGQGRWETRIKITDQDGSIRDISVSYLRDGHANSGKGYKGEGDSAAVNSPAPNVLVMSLAKDKGLESVRVYAVSANGREMIESAADVDDEGVPFVRNFHYKRIRR